MRYHLDKVVKCQMDSGIDECFGGKSKEKARSPVICTVMVAYLLPKEALTVLPCFAYADWGLFGIVSCWINVMPTSRQRSCILLAAVASRGL